MSETASIWQFVLDRVAATPDAVMLLDADDREVTFEKYRDWAERTAAGLHEQGVSEGDTVAWQMPTWIETVVLLGALCRLGVRQVPLLPIYGERELTFILDQCGASTFVVPATWRGTDYAGNARRIETALGTFRTLVCDHELPEAGPATLPPFDAAALDPEEPRWVFYTSGTTAEPKGVRHTDHAVIEIGVQMVVRQGFEGTDRFGIAFPFTHIGGLTNYCVCLYTGLTLVLLESFVPAQAVDVFARLGVTTIGGGPAFYRAFVDEQRRRGGPSILPALRFISGGGAPMPPELHCEVRDEVGGLGCANGFGMTEGVIMAINDPRDTDDHLMSTSGRALDGMEIRAVDGSGAPLPPDAEGELQIRGVGLFHGYLDESLNGDVSFTHDGWFRTGDVGRLDADGYVTVTGRLKDIIIRKGENISAKAIEDLLYAHPKIADAAVIGVPDIERGEMVCAVVTLADPTDPLTLDEIAEYMTEAGTMRQKIPERLEIIDEMPRNATGKIVKNDLRAKFGE
jgi:acyl-CoA synthetase (AMP-forming)/AMP-acid ligase II